MACTCTTYDAAESKALLDRVDDMVKYGEEMRALRVEPTIDRRHRILETIFQFVRSNDRVVYGGHAQDRAMGGEVYNTVSERSMADVEFYSPEPVKDLRALCDRLHEDGHPKIQGRAAAHKGTFTISVACTRICDITFVPPRIFGALPLLPTNDAATMSTDAGVKTIHPHVCLIDLMRILCDPATSYWRLPRLLPRLFSLQERYPLFDSADADADPFPPAAMAEGPSTRCRVLRDWAASRGDSIALVPGLGDASRELTFISVDYRTDYESLMDSLALPTETEGSRSRSRSSTKLLYREYRPFMDCIGSRVEIRGERPWVTIIDSGPRMVPVVSQGPAGPQRAAYEVSVIHAMSMMLMGRTRGVDAITSAYSRALRRLLADHDDRARRSLARLSLARDGDGGSSAASIRFIGQPMTSLQMHLDDNGRSPWYTYSPVRKAASCRASFPECDGGPCSQFKGWPT